MTDYIKREDAIKAFDPSQRRDWYTPWIVETLEDLPSADVAPVRHGRWRHERLPSTSGGSYSVVRCSACKYQYPMTEVNYCPNCGARMDEEE